MVWILIGYMWLFIHRPFEIWPIFATIRIERTYMIFAIFAWFMFSAKSWTSNLNNAALSMVAFSILVSTALSPYGGLGNNLVTENWFKVFVFFLLIMTSVTNEKDMKILITGFTVCFTLYMLHSFREYLNGRGVFRMGIWRMIGVDKTFNNANAFGNGINYALPLLLPLLVFAREIKNKMRKRLAYLLVIVSFVLSAICIQLTGSRSSFAVLGGSLLGLTLMSKYRVRILVIFAVFVSVVWVSTPPRLKIRYISLFDPSVLEGADMGAAQASAEGRIAGFWNGVEVWKGNIPFGVGPGCFARTSISGGFQTHQLYGQVLSELGALGALAYTFLVGSFLMNYFDAKRLIKQLKDRGREQDGRYLYQVVFATGYACFLLLVLGFGGHNAFRFTWVWYAAFQGLAVGMLRKKVELVTAPNLQRKPMERFGSQVQTVKSI